MLVAKINNLLMFRIVAEPRKERMLLQTASGGRALQGILLTKRFQDQLQSRSCLLEAPEDVVISRASLYDMKNVQFLSAHEENEYKKSVEVLGYSIAAADVPVNVYGGIAIGASESTGHKTTTQKQEVYCSIGKQYIVEVASYRFREKDMELSTEAKDDLKDISSMIQSQGKNCNDVHKACERFFDKYGSHVNGGPIKFGGISFWTCSSDDFSQEEALALKMMQNSIVSATAGVRISGTEMNVNEIKKSYQGTCSEKALTSTHLRIKIHGGPPKARKLKQWKEGLANSSTWIIIDRGNKLIAVWDIIKRNHQKELGAVRNVLRNVWERMTGLKAEQDLQSEAHSSADEILDECGRWHIADMSREEIGRKLNYLMKVKNGNPGIWITDYLSQPSLQQLLVSIVDKYMYQEPSEFGRVKFLAMQLAEEKELIKFNAQTFPCLDKVTQWLYDYKPVEVTRTSRPKPLQKPAVGPRPNIPKPKPQLTKPKPRYKTGNGQCDVVSVSSYSGVQTSDTAVPEASDTAACPIATFVKSDTYSQHDKNAWERMTELKAEQDLQSETHSSTEEILDECGRWHIADMSCQEIGRKLNYLMKVKNGNPGIWITDYLSQPSLQQLLVSIVDKYMYQEPSEFGHIKFLAMQLAEQKELIKFNAQTFPCLDKVTQWLYDYKPVEVPRTSRPKRPRPKPNISKPEPQLPKPKPRMHRTGTGQGRLSVSLYSGVQTSDTAVPEVSNTAARPTASCVTPDTSSQHDRNREEYLRIIRQGVSNRVAEIKSGEVQLDEVVLEAEFDQLWCGMMQAFPFIAGWNYNIEAEVEAKLLEFRDDYRDKMRQLLLEKPLTKRGLNLNLQVNEHFKLLGVMKYIRSSPANRQAVNEITSEIFDAAKEHLEKQTAEEHDFHPGLIVELLQLVDHMIDEDSKRIEDTVILTSEYRIQVFLAVCGYAVPVFQQMAESFNERTDPRIYLERNVKHILLRQFIDQCRQDKGEFEEAIANALCASLAGPIEAQIRINNMGVIMVRQLKTSESHCFSSKMALKAKVLIDLREEDEFEGYMEYVQDVRKCLMKRIEDYVIKFCNGKPGGRETRLQQAAKGEVTRLLQLVEEKVLVVEERNVWEWLLEFCKDEQLKEEV